MKYNLLLVSCLIISFFYVLSSCTADKLEPPSNTDTLDCTQTDITYNDHIRGIMDRHCNTSGCHDGSVMQPFGAYSNIDQTRRERIYTRACVTRDMPPTGGLPIEVIDSISCWATQGYLES
jgi:hypothetical protein